MAAPDDRLLERITGAVVKMTAALAGLVVAVTGLLLACSTPGVQGVVGSVFGAGGDSGAEVSAGGAGDPGAMSWAEIVTRLELAAERLQCTPAAVHDVVTIERDRLLADLVTAATDREILRESVVGEVGAAVTIPPGATVGAAVAELLREFNAAQDREAAALERAEAAEGLVAEYQAIGARGAGGEGGQ